MNKNGLNHIFSFCSEDPHSENINSWYWLACYLVISVLLSRLSISVFVAMRPCHNLLAAHERRQIRDTHAEMNTDFSLWAGDYYCLHVPRLKKASSRVKITTTKTGESLEMQVCRKLIQFLIKEESVQYSI